LTWFLNCTKLLAV